MKDKNKFLHRYGSWALITGGSSGMGAEFARQLGAMGFNLILVARRLERMQQLAEQITAEHKVDIKIIQQDLADNDFMQAIIKQTTDLDIGLLINGAGFALTGPLLDNDIEDEQGLLEVNCRAPLLLTHYFANKMRQRNKKQQKKTGGVIFLSSIVAFSAVPKWGNYAASKAYNLLLSESLSSELQQEGIAVLALTPGPTATEFQQVAGVRDFMVMDVEQVVSKALSSLGKRSLVIPGWLNRYNKGFGIY